MVNNSAWKKDSPYCNLRETGSPGGARHFVSQQNILRRLHKREILRRPDEIWCPFATNTLHFAAQAKIYFQVRSSTTAGNIPTYCETKPMIVLLLFPACFATEMDFAKHTSRHGMISNDENELIWCPGE